MQFDPETKVYNLKTVGNGKIYEYETENQELFNKKANDIYHALEESKGSAFEWLVGGGVLITGAAMIGLWCMDPVGFDGNQKESNEQNEAIF